MLPVLTDYPSVLTALEQQVRAAKLTAQRRVNTQLIELYWAIGHVILERRRMRAGGVPSSRASPKTSEQSSPR